MKPDPAASPAVQERLDTAELDLFLWAQVVDVSGLPDKTIRWCEDYLRRYRHMMLGASREEANRLFAVIETRVSPPPPPFVAPLDVIAAVVEVRRKRPSTG